MAWISPCLVPEAKRVRNTVLSVNSLKVISEIGSHGGLTRENRTKDKSQAGNSWRVLGLSLRNDLSKLRRRGSCPLSSPVANFIGLDMAVL